ncbi:putative selenium-dependent hydroxylase accessory protein YqeC [Haloarcula sp. CBA1130]|uniref:selenium cofactor biosynthesis protein YqeC n=1 Tax=unclassified Haloarcula TaxID=2624677 RepID=UPI001247C6E3|nr:MULTISPECIES: selenium cofactor biosynthesis protein YqeC [unclassified Haloarcula]KAA9398062.1 putative selenium-dependent hydroxylase accessory protein YqeC [Haloarcula sp. CBA1129]KAA9402250.1 putative selenium-dependent hydroxylase accessory protein YqeC [Haloarcula sp. CBA1130]
MDIVDALDAWRGTTCFVGAGGKKTTMATLARRLDRAVVTATVRIPIFDGWVKEVVVTETPRTAIDGASTWPLGVVPAQERPDRYRGYDPETVADLADIDHPILVKADGARMREFKAPSDREPQLPSTASTVVPIASAHVVGRALTDDIVHRVDEVAAITGLDSGDEIQPRDVAAVLASDRGGLKDVPADATAVPLLNMVDDDELEASARAVAEAVHERADVPRVVLAEMRAEDPLVAVI